MEKITRYYYVAADGSEFESEALCRAYENEQGIKRFFMCLAVDWSDVDFVKLFNELYKHRGSLKSLFEKVE
jgi:hypothetical protein